MSDRAKGVAAMVAACVIWGLSPMFYKLLVHVPPLEVLSHRTLWSFVIFGLILVFQGRFGQVVAALSNWRGFLLIGFAGVLISLNWFGFILSIQIGRAVEASLGYYIYPLVAVVLGYLVFGERLSRAQGLAVALAVLAVAVLTLGLGSTPAIALLLAGSFGIYGVIKKKLTVSPVVSVTGEVLILAPLALIWLWGVHMLGWGGFVGRSGGYFGTSWSDSLLLVFSGALTAGPLILFSYAANRLSMSSVGLIQYLNPTLQFGVAVLVFREAFTLWHGITFGLIWLALAIYTVASLRQEKSLPRASSASSTVSTTDM